MQPVFKERSQTLLALCDVVAEVRRLQLTVIYCYCVYCLKLLLHEYTQYIYVFIQHSAVL